MEKRVVMLVCALPEGRKLHKVKVNRQRYHAKGSCSHGVFSRVTEAKGRKMWAEPHAKM